jgi:hypothetical protein
MSFSDLASEEEIEAMRRYLDSHPVPEAVINELVQAIIKNDLR